MSRRLPPAKSGTCTVYVFLDGEERGLVLPGTDSTLRIPVTSGARPLVNFCGYFDAGEKKEWRCSTPTNVAFVKSDQMLVIYPLK